MEGAWNAEGKGLSVWDMYTRTCGTTAPGAKSASTLPVSEE
ncbi:MAG: glycosyl hydrolase family protein [Cupriavidus sp.]|nr:MAG: glycosyl hydrolase family protein [Cupriavidus sp.]